MIKCVVPISGGKDSQTCLKLAMKKFEKDEILGLFCDTKFEHPETYKHIRWMENEYGVQIVTVNFGDVYSKVINYGRFPSGAARFCTDELKIRPSKQFYSMLARLQGEGFEIWYGMRLNESIDRNKRYSEFNQGKLYPPHKVMPKKYPMYLDAMGVAFRLPILEWSEDEVFEELNGEQNPLYEHVGRVGCFPCLASGDAHKEKCFGLDEVGKQRRIEVLEIGHKIKKNIFTTIGGRKRNPDADPNREYDYDYTGSVYEAPCHICNI